MIRSALVITLLLTATAAGAAATPAAMERQLLAAINGVRAEHGLDLLAPLPELQRLARLHSADMLAANRLSHESRRGGLRERATAAGLDYRMIGENVAMNYGLNDPVEAAVRGWMNSPGHRANILEPGYTHTGIGVAADGGTFYYTQIFMQAR